MAEVSNSNVIDVDSLYSALSDLPGEEIGTLSDAEFAEELQLQEALMASVISAQMSLGSSRSQEEVMESPKANKKYAGESSGSSKIEENPMKTLKAKEKDVGESSGSSTVEENLLKILKGKEKDVGEFSGSSTTEENPMKTLKAEEKEAIESSQCFCGICMEGKLKGEIFGNKACSHNYCTDCISKHVVAKIQESVEMVKCPELDCKAVLEPGLWFSIIPDEVSDRWLNALCESTIPGSQKFYCPFKDCSAVLVDEGEEVVKEAECPDCRRLFCAECKVSWHSGVTCEEFQELNEDDRKKEDLMVMELAKKNKWGRCPQCKYFVEKGEGCLHITCRCGFQFCYGCGSTWAEDHGGCQID